MIPHSKPTLGKEEKAACLRVLDSQQIAQGRQVEAFEKGFCRLTGRRYAIAVNSGSAALSLALRVLKVGPGDEVIVPSYNCAALLHAVDSVGAKAKPVDIEAADFNLSVSETRRAVGPKTKALIAASLFGNPGRIRELVQLGVPVIEDGTQALGAYVGHHSVGSFGVISVFSFYATKMMTTGEGGIILTDSKALAGTLYDLRDYDKKERHCFRTNSKMTDFQAAIGIEQLKKLPQFVRRRRKIAKQYNQCCFISTGHVFFRYVLRIPGNLQKCIREFRRRGIDAKRPVFKPLHRYLGMSDARFPETVRAMGEVCSLPIFPSMTDKECTAVAKVIQSIKRTMIHD
ncbi:MAG: DegT/DnrJ/EryC1/StrS family aminotransferase [Candidatus Omnitrophota bacterium]